MFINFYGISHISCYFNGAQKGPVKRVGKRMISILSMVIRTITLN